ncbi:MAG: FYDLN acid domain-containing protein, partial [Proteobacteria bacterium]|nr:FYDLN acid domain-containing protein [Pseudomonadota bacterium]
MDAAVATPERGLRRRCAKCGSPFYDLRRAPIVCPKCGTELQPPVSSRRAPVTRTPTGRDPEAPVA